MKAVRMHDFGGPEVLTVDDVEAPRPGPGEVLIKVAAASVNPVDYKMREGAYLKREQLPAILGRDVAGQIASCGEGVSDFQPGDEVFVMLDPGHGGYAEFVTARAEVCANAPKGLSEVEAAAVPLAAMTAWQGLFDAGGLAAGQNVLIHGAAGGVGHFAVQFAKARGAKVFATCSDKDVAFVRELGADAVIDYQTQRFEDVARDIDVVFDLVNGETQDRSWAVVKDGGIIVSTLRAPAEDAAKRHHARGAHYSAHPDGRELRQIALLIEAGEVRPHIARTFALDEAAQAEEVLERDHVQGKIVLEVR
jgi:NADPH:quinone reductase-like Zn-dependent oxidoreductase